jgi:hypothetical protein
MVAPIACVAEHCAGRASVLHHTVAGDRNEQSDYFKKSYHDFFCFFATGSLPAFGLLAFALPFPFFASSAAAFSLMRSGTRAAAGAASESS